VSVVWSVLSSWLFLRCVGRLVHLEFMAVFALCRWSGPSRVHGCFCVVSVVWSVLSSWLFLCCVGGLVRLEFMAVFKVVNLWIVPCFIFESFS